MNYFIFTMKVLSAFLMSYFFLVFVRIILSWFPDNSPHVSRVKEFLDRITEPYMKHFRKIKWLRIGILDFSAMFALSILSFTLYITQRLSSGYIPSLTELLFRIIQMVWGVASFIFLLLIFLLGLRLACIYLVHGNRPYWIERLDGILFPLVSRVIGLFTGKTLSYPIALGINLVVFLLIRILGKWILTIVPGILTF